MKRLGAGLLCLALCYGCETAAEPPFELQWRLAWDTSGVTVTPDGWQVTNGLGFTFVVTRGYLVTYGLQLRPCDTTTSAAMRLWQLIQPVQQAWAGHSGLNDQSFIYGEVEPLVPVGEGLVRTISLPDAASYCSVHYLVARADNNLDTSAATVPMDRVTLHLEGWWSAPGSNAQSPIAINSELNTGSYIDLSQPITAADGAGATVVVTRQLADFFEGLDPSALSETRFTQSLLLNIAAAATVSQP